MLKILIVGAGFAGATLARCLAEKGYIIEVIDKRDHLAGNAYDYIEPTAGIRVHEYGPHIFHTNNKDVFDFLSQFTDWIPYKHKVKAAVVDKTKAPFEHIYVTMPPNKHTKKTLDDLGLGMINTLYRPYSEKMWGLPLEKIDPSITDRVKIRDDDNEYYFPDDEYQFMPKNGYTELIHNMLMMPNIKVCLSTPFSREMEDEYDYVFNSMPIDEYYGELYGPLEYRSIEFTKKIFDKKSTDYWIRNPTDAATINSTTSRHESPETRKTYWSMFPNNINTDTEIITTEVPCAGRGAEKFYPVKDLDGKNKARYEKYKAIPNNKMTFIGRLGNYVYIDMHQAVNASLQLAKKYPNFKDDDDSTKKKKRSS